MMGDMKLIWIARGAVHMITGLAMTAATMVTLLYPMVQAAGYLA